MGDKEKEIREMTIKGLEPEIERLIKKNKEETKKLMEKHALELEEIKSILLEEYDTKFKKYKEKVMQETEEIITKERHSKNEKMKE